MEAGREETLTDELTDHSRLTTRTLMVRFLLLFFPAGLIIGGIAAVWLYHRDEERKKQAQQPHISARALTAAALERHHERLTTKPGVSSIYLRSSLGEKNLGASVQELRGASAAAEGSVLVVDVPGSDLARRREIVLVIAGFDSIPTGSGDAIAAAVLAGIVEEAAADAAPVTVRYAFVEQKTQGSFSSGVSLLMNGMKAHAETLRTALVIGPVESASLSVASTERELALNVSRILQEKSGQPAAPAGLPSEVNGLPGEQTVVVHGTRPNAPAAGEPIKILWDETLKTAQGLRQTVRVLAQ